MLFDSKHETNKSINLHQEKIKADNAIDVFKKHKVPKDIGILSVTAQLTNYWILEAILAEYNSKLIIHQVNQKDPSFCVTVPKEESVWDGTEFYGGNICAYHCLAKRFQYTMIYCDSTCSTCFWVRNDLIRTLLRSNPHYVQAVLVPEVLYQKPIKRFPESNKAWHQIKCQDA